MSEEISPGPREIVIDKEGHWFYRGAEIVRRDIVELFCRHLERDHRGGYLIRWQGQECPVSVEDTPLVVWGTSRVEEDGKIRGILLHLSDGTSEMLDPSSFYVGAGNVPYCGVRGGVFPARFSRKAYYELAGMVEEDSSKGTFALRIGAHRYPIRRETENP